MVPPNDAAHVLPIALWLGALLMAGLAVAFWTGLIDVGETRVLAAVLVGAAAVFEFVLGFVFFSRTRS